MQDWNPFSQTGPESEAQKERRVFTAMAVERARMERRERWKGRVSGLKSLFRK